MLKTSPSSSSDQRWSILLFPSSSHSPIHRRCAPVDFGSVPMSSTTNPNSVDSTMNIGNSTASAHARNKKDADRNVGLRLRTELPDIQRDLLRGAGKDDLLRGRCGVDCAQPVPPKRPASVRPNATRGGLR